MRLKNLNGNTYVIRKISVEAHVQLEKYHVQVEKNLQLTYIYKNPSCNHAQLEKISIITHAQLKNLNYNTSAIRIESQLQLSCNYKISITAIKKS
jgi:hypothetical protein